MLMMLCLKTTSKEGLMAETLVGPARAGLDVRHCPNQVRLHFPIDRGRDARQPSPGQQLAATRARCAVCEMIESRIDESQAEYASLVPSAVLSRPWLAGITPFTLLTCRPQRTYGFRHELNTVL